MLVGGLLGLYCGSCLGSEWWVAAGFGLGYVAGAVVGAVFGYTMLSQKKPAKP